MFKDISYLSLYYQEMSGKGNTETGK